MEELKFFLGAEINVGSAAMPQYKMCFGSVGIAFMTTMKKTTLKFVDCVCSCIETIHSVTAVRDSIFPIISNVLNSSTDLTLLPQTHVHYNW